LPAQYKGIDLKGLREKFDIFFKKVQEAGAHGMRGVDIGLVPKIPIPE